MRINTYVKPKSVNEAYDILCQHRKNEIIGGGCWLKLLPKEIETAIDLSHCELDYINQTKDTYEIGSTVTLRALEKFSHRDGILAKSIGEVMGVTFRNVATIGGTVAGKFGFSDIITTLLVLDTKLMFIRKGVISLESYLKNKEKEQDILTGLSIKKQSGKGTFYTLKKTANDFPIVNIALIKNNEGYKISVGARPGVATLAKNTMDYINTTPEVDETAIEKAATLLLEEVSFGTNTRGSKDYRRAVIKGLLGRGLKEVNRCENTITY